MFWLACLGLVIAVCFNGVGARDDHITLDMIADISKYYVIFQNVYIWSNAPIKISVCLSIHRVLKHYVWISWTLYFMIFVIVSSSIGINIWLLTFCYPIEYQWNKTISGTCRPLKALVPVAMAWSYINIIVDWSVALLPVFVLWRANMPWQHKLTVAGVLSLGIFASCATIIRLVHLEYLTSMKNYFCKSTLRLHACPHRPKHPLTRTTDGIGLIVWLSPSSFLPYQSPGVCLADDYATWMLRVLYALARQTATDDSMHTRKKANH